MTLVITILLVSSFIYGPFRVWASKPLSSVDVGWQVYWTPVKTDRWRAILNVTLTNNADTTIHIPWMYVNFFNVTYVDNSFEDMGITGNFTTNYVIYPTQRHLVSITFTEYGFDKKPLVIEYEIRFYIAEAKDFLRIYTEKGAPIPEFQAPIVLLILTLIAVQAATRNLPEKAHNAHRKFLEWRKTLVWF